MTTANIATGGAAMAGKVIMGTAAGTMGSASAIQAAFQKALASMSRGGDIPNMGSIGGSGGYGSRDGNGSGDEAGQSSRFDGNSLSGSPSNDEVASSANCDTNNNEGRN